MTRDAEHTPSPQSVVVPLEDWKHVIGALKNAKARLPLGAAIGNVSDALSKVEHLQAAPAPEVHAIIETLEALTKGPDHDEFDRGARAARLDALDMIRPLAALSPEAPARDGSSAIASIIAERTRQVDVEGWTPEHDDEHDDYSLGLAAASYAGGVDCGSKIVTYTDDVSGGRGDTPVWGVRKKRVPVPWPEAWDARWWKPTGDRRRDLVKAGALIVAEIERLDRQSLDTTKVEGC